MDYPEELSPTCAEAFTLLTGEVVSLPKCRPKFAPWQGAVAFDTYGKKTVLDFCGEPVFAELAILRVFERAGWNGVWVDTYRGRYRTAVEQEVSLPVERHDLLQRIRRAAGARGGCFDVFVWSSQRVVFAESKRDGHDRVRPSQLRWLRAALKSGLPRQSFLVVEWSLQDADVV